MAFIKKVLPEIISAFNILRDVRSVLVDYGKKYSAYPLPTVYCNLLTNFKPVFRFFN